MFLLGDLRIAYRSIAPWLLPLIEASLVLCAVWMSLRAKPSSSRLLLRIESRFRYLSRKRVLSVLFVFLVTLCIRLALIPVLGIPQPAWNDEYSHLLAASTFASGRLTNPTHPMWIHFESFHIIQQPSYMSMYAPGQGLVMAAGILLGHPWIGVLLMCALMCAALCWMLQGWFSPEWALFGAMLAVLRFSTFSYWMNSYWCPTLAATGGMLVLGAIPRLQAHPRIWHTLLIALGLVMMANSRPYEGLVFSVAVAVGTVFWIRSRRFPWRLRMIPNLILPALCLLVIAGAGMGYYYWKVTGSPFRMTYKVNRETYAVVPYFIFFSKRAVPQYHHPVMRDYYAGWEVDQYNEARTLRGFARRTGTKISQLWRFFVGPAFSLPLLAFPRILRDRRVRLALVACAVFSVGCLVETWTFAHYVAPAMGLFYLLLVQSARHMNVWRWRKGKVGHRLVRSVPIVCVGMIIIRLAGIVAHAPMEPPWPVGNLDRIAVIEKLNKIPGDHLVVVRYGPDHNVDRDWIYNPPDIDRARIVWARDMGTLANEELLRYFSNRHVWLMSGDDSPPTLEPYPPN